MPVLIPLILAAMTALTHHEPTREELAIAEAIEGAVQGDAEGPALTTSHDEDAVLLVVYAWHESGFSERPRAVSWDAKAGRSLGVWQMQRQAVLGHSLEEQAATWLRWAHEGGLAGLDSSPSRAARRELEARALLVRAMGEAR